MYSTNFGYSPNQGDRSIDVLASLVLERDKIESFSQFVISASGTNMKCGYSVDRLPGNYAGQYVTWVTSGTKYNIPAYNDYIVFVLKCYKDATTYMYASVDGTITFS